MQKGRHHPQGCRPLLHKRPFFVNFTFTILKQYFMRITSPERPKEVAVGNHLGQKQRTINFDIQQQTLDDFPQYVYRSVTLAPGVWTRDAIISALIDERYPHDKMDAVVNNYLADPTDAEAKEEFDEMQSWRREAKKMADRLLEEYS